MNKIKRQILQQAILDYRNDGKELMHKLGKKFGLDIRIKDDYEKLISRSTDFVPRKGELSNKWTIVFMVENANFIIGSISNL